MLIRDVSFPCTCSVYKYIKYILFEKKYTYLHDKSKSAPCQQIDATFLYFFLFSSRHCKNTSWVHEVKTPGTSTREPKFLPAKIIPELIHLIHLKYVK